MFTQAPARTPEPCKFWPSVPRAEILDNILSVIVALTLLAELTFILVKNSLLHLSMLLAIAAGPYLQINFLLYYFCLPKL